MSAEFQMLGVFTVLGLERGLPRWFSRAAMVLLFAGILTAKSNGTLIALATGLTVWALWRTHARGVPARRLAGALALAAVAIVLPAWLLSETGLGGEWLEKIREKSLLARMSHSSDVRGRIWERLEGRLVEQPLGIGPGNSSVGFVEIGETERPGGLDAKEAHNDYLGYAVERGPLGVLGLLAGLVAIVTRLARGRRALEARTGDAGRAIAIQAAGLGALAGLLVQSTVIEQLHFRHLWWWVAWMWAATGPVQVASAARAAISRRPVVAGHPDSAANPAPGGAPA
jgi:hypothetical protein